MTATTLQADQEHGTVTASTESFELKSSIVKGRERETVEGFLATTHIDKGNDEFTVQALKSMAEDINSEDVDTVDAVFNDVDTEALKEAQVGNLDHNNNPGAPFGDTRTVPAFKVINADVRDTGDGNKGLWIKAVLNSDGMLPETVSAVKNSIKDNFLNAFSIEFLPKKVKQISKGDKVIRRIMDAAAKGAALTGRPMNPAARMTDAMLKSMTDEYKVEYSYEVGDNVSWNETSGTVRDRTKDSCFNERIDGDFEVCGEQEDPAYLIEVDNDEESMAGHKQSFLQEEGNKNMKAELTDEQRTPPEAAQENAQMYLDAKDEGKVGSDCGTGTGTRRAKQIAEGDPLSTDVIEDIASFARHEGNSEADVDEGESKWQDCGYAMWKAWGGDDGVRWAQDKNEMMDEKSQLKQDYRIQTPDYEATSESSWEKPAEEDFPDDYDVMSIFMARNPESDNFSDQALPVVDYRDGEATLVLEALRSAHQLAPQVEGLSEEEVNSVRNKAENIAEDEFDVMLGGDADSEHMEKNDTKTMTDEENVEEEVNDEPEPEPEEGEGDEESETESEAEPNEGSEDESVQLQEDVADLKSKFEDLKETNESLREKNEELKSELEDLKTVQEVKNDLDEIKNMVGDIPLEDGPKVEQEQKRFDGDKAEQKAEWKSILDGMANPQGYLETEGKSKSNLEVFSKRHGVNIEEVKNYVTSN